MWNVLPMLRWSFQWRIETSVLCIARLNGRYWANNRITWAKNSTITLWRREAKHHHQQPMATSCWAIGIMQLDTQAVVESDARWFVWGHRCGIASTIPLISASQIGESIIQSPIDEEKRWCSPARLPLDERSSLQFRWLWLFTNKVNNRWLPAFFSHFCTM